MVRSADVDHRLDGEHHPGAQIAVRGPAARSWGPRGPRAWRCRCRDRRIPGPPKSRPRWARPSTAAPMSPRRAPAPRGDRRVERGPGHFEKRSDSSSIGADRDRDRGVGTPTLDDRPAVDRHDVAVVKTRSPGMPWTMTSFGDIQVTAGKPWYPRKFERCLAGRGLHARRVEIGRLWHRPYGARAGPRASRRLRCPPGASTRPDRVLRRTIQPDRYEICAPPTLTSRSNTSSPSPTPLTW